MGEHYITKCRGCGTVVGQCRCMGQKEERWVPSCPKCVEPEVPAPTGPQPMIWAVQSYDYGRTADQGPASRLKNVEPAIKTAEREIEKAKGILHGLLREVEMVAKHTSDATIKKNFDSVRDFSTRLDDIDKDLDGFSRDLEKFLRSYR